MTREAAEVEKEFVEVLTIPRCEKLWRLPCNWGSGRMAQRQQAEWSWTLITVGRAKMCMAGTEEAAPKAHVSLLPTLL